MGRKAFTLIELLVVIAIIAILAAILFPVFAQAKAAAKATASVSNEKQQALAVIMYSGDVDDKAPIDCIWGQHDALYWYGSWNSAFSPWSYEITPYTKNGGILEDPQTTPNPGSTPGYSQDQWNAYNPEYGYNYSALSPWTSEASTPWIRNPVSFTSLSRPSETVMTSTHGTSAETPGYWFGPGTQLTQFTVEAPNCGQIVPYCIDNWGSGWWESVAMNGNRTAGAYTGYNSIRKAGSGIVSFCDGHVKVMQPGSMAAGTNWNPNIADSAVVFTDTTKYLWGNVQ